MKKIKIKVFDANNVSNKEYYKQLGLNIYDLEKYHNQILNNKGMIKPKKNNLGITKLIKPLDEDLEERFKYELDKDEKLALSIMKNNLDQAEKLYDSAKRKYHKYLNTLIEKLDIEEVYDGEDWNCSLSPFGKCLYHQDSSGEYLCIFCGEPEERK